MSALDRPGPAYIAGPFRFPSVAGFPGFSCYGVAFLHAPERGPYAGAFPAGAINSTLAESLAHAGRVVAAYNAPDSTAEGVLAAWRAV